MGGIIVGVLRIAVAGGTGRTGREVVRYLTNVEGIIVVGVVARSLAGKSMSVVLPELARDIPIYSDLTDLCAANPPHVLVDFTHPDAARHHFYTCLNEKIHPIIGTTGLADEDIQSFAKACAEARFGGAVIPNFSLGAMVQRQAACLISKVLHDVSIMEVYPRSKKDIPSGTSLQLLRELQNCRLEQEHDIHIHSIRLDGAMPRQEVWFGADGEIVTLTHEASDRRCFGRGVAIAAKNIGRFTRLVTELESFLQPG